MNEKVFKDYHDFPYDEFANCPLAAKRRGQKKKKNKNNYLDAIAAFDIETTKIPYKNLAVMFIWQFHISFDDNEYTVLGRTWEEFTAFMEFLAAIIPDGYSLLIFDHNFNYEMGYLLSQIDFTNSKGNPDVFAIDVHKPIQASSHHGKFEWRDSLVLFAGSGLAEVTKGLPHEKLGDFDYTMKRFSWTPLTDEEYQYCINDVYGLTEAVRELMRIHNDNLYSLPLTSTGFIRRDIARLMKNHTDRQDYPADNYWVYEVLRKSFRGGNTHSNRFYTGEIIKED